MTNSVIILLYHIINDYSGTVNNNSGIVNGSINTDKKSATLVVSLSTYKNAQFLTNTNLENEEQVTLKVQLNGIIKSIYFDGSEQSPGYETAYFLMEDGTLYYAYIFEKVNSMKSASDNVITVTIAKGISDVKEIKNGETVGELVNTTALAIKNDGTFYVAGHNTTATMDLYPVYIDLISNINTIFEGHEQDALNDPTKRDGVGYTSVIKNNNGICTQYN